MVATGYVLPSTLGHATTHTGTGLVSLLVSTSNLAIGLFGVVVLVVGIVRLMKELFAHYKGGNDKSGAYTPGFTNTIAGVPKMFATILDIMIGFVVVGLVMSGAWVGVVNALIGIGSHVGTQVSTHLTTTVSSTATTTPPVSGAGG
ncbi:hypothetical protein [Sulfobacillus sp. hq2]|uniref:hypothetical protein n=1 Tax=Sulfobacillus TaxID=28033 RepID=UPI000CD099FA|nr:hypothetical protein [Sulfobacillus sp. hq2]POB09684.1 hypothetical protein CO251_15895 [Sulfobacillus sp. hq2]